MNIISNRLTAYNSNGQIIFHATSSSHFSDAKFKWGNQSLSSDNDSAIFDFDLSRINPEMHSEVWAELIDCKSNAALFTIDTTNRAYTGPSRKITFAVNREEQPSVVMSVKTNTYSLIFPRGTIEQSFI